MMTANANPTARYQEKQDHVLAVASQVFAEKGYHEASMRDIARASGASLAGLYYYAQSKEELLHAITARTFDTVIAGAEAVLAETEDPAEQIAGIIRNHLLYFAAHLDAMKVLSHEAESLTGTFQDAIQEKKRAYVALVESVLRRLGNVEDERKIEAFSLFGMMNWIYTWYRPEEGGIEPVCRTMTELFLRGYLGTVGRTASHNGGR